MRYILKQQLCRFGVIAAMIGYTYLQFHRIHDMEQLDWYLVVAINVLGLLAIVVITAKIKIATAHMRHHQQEGQNHAD